jgi:hypothetical protein
MAKLPLGPGESDHVLLRITVAFLATAILAILILAGNSTSTLLWLILAFGMHGLYWLLMRSFPLPSRYSIPDLLMDCITLTSAYSTVCFLLAFFQSDILKSKAIRSIFFIIPFYFLIHVFFSAPILRSFNLWRLAFDGVVGAGSLIVLYDTIRRRHLGSWRGLILLFVTGLLVFAEMMRLVPALRPFANVARDFLFLMQVMGFHFAVERALSKSSGEASGVHGHVLGDSISPGTADSTELKVRAAFQLGEMMPLEAGQYTLATGSHGHLTGSRCWMRQWVASTGEMVVILGEVNGRDSSSSLYIGCILGALARYIQLRCSVDDALAEINSALNLAFSGYVQSSAIALSVSERGTGRTYAFGCPGWLGESGPPNRVSTQTLPLGSGPDLHGSSCDYELGSDARYIAIFPVDLRNQLNESECRQLGASLAANELAAAILERSTELKASDHALVAILNRAG